MAVGTYKANQPKANVGVRIALGDTATAEALLKFIDDYSAGNLWVISNDTEILKSITDKYSIVRAVVDFTGDVVRGPANITYNFDTDEDGTVEDTKGADASAPNKVIGGEYADKTAAIFEYKNYTGGYEALSWDNVYDLTIVNGYRTMLLPESAVTKEHVYSLHGSLMTVFVETEADSEIGFYDLIVTGVNGILST